MRLGRKLVDAIASSFIEVRLGEDEETPPAVEAAPVPTAAPSRLPTPAPEPEPVVVARAPFTPPDLSGAFQEDGSLNDGVIYSDATLGSVPFTAEQAIDVLVELPYGVSSRTRFEAMRQALGVLGDDPSGAGHLVVSDAAQKMVALNKYLMTTRDEVKGFRREVAEEMERLHERLNQLRQLVENTNGTHNTLEELARARVDNLTGVIAFFDEFQAYLRLGNEDTAPRTGEELPAFMREDTAMKLLGVTRDAA